MKKTLLLFFILSFNSAIAQSINFNEYFIYDSNLKSKNYGTGIDLSRTEIEDEDLKQLKETRFQSVSWLSLRSTAVTDQGLKYLAKLKLRTLILEDTEITGEGFSEIKDLPLKVLNLENTKIDDAGLEYLRNFKLTDLNLTGTKITDQGIFILRDLPLENLNLYSTSISDLGLENLKGLNLPLKKLFLTGTQTSETKVNWLRDKLPGVTIIY